MTDFLKDLNPDQRAAVTHGAGPALVLAGAGSGKTTVLTRRACWLLQNSEARFDQVLLVTFTNKAAQEMCSRIEQLTGQQLPYAGTFHRLCARMLRQNGRLIGLSPDYVIYDSDDQQMLMRNLYKQHGWQKNVKPQVARSMISSAKNELLTPATYAAQASSETEYFVSQVFREYERALREANAVDFDDLLLKVIELMQISESTRVFYQEQFLHVLVDEYQDTNKAQYALTTLWAAPHNNLFVVGDFCQSIYSWRGADFRNMMEMKNDFSQHQEYRLEQNYRSTQTILDAASMVIDHNNLHPTLNLWTDESATKPLGLIEASTGAGEAELIADWINNKHTGKLADIAILYRTNAQSRLFEETFIRAHIAYRLIGGTKFYERKEIKDVLSYARFLTNSTDIVSQQRLLKLGKRKFSAYKNWAESNVSLTTKPPQEVLQAILKATSYLDLYDERVEEEQGRIDNVLELLAMSAEFTTVAQLLETIALLEDTDAVGKKSASGPSDAVNLMSLHAAKGLEFDTVFLVGMEEGLLPHSRSLYDPAQLEEERRLCYVGITRAKQQLVLSYAHYRSQYGASTTAIPSRFLAEIPQELFGGLVGNASTATSAPSSKQRKLVSDDDLDALLHGELDIASFLDR
ncbi:UvrD-helicase domain-containing protein [Candidatus Woesebacteria bacterium]|nr:UvrD-helicase domain-containing protein [Candidatus Woesebacteria bacterium]